MYKQWQSAKAEDKHQSAVSTYGPEHLCRLLGKFFSSLSALFISSDTS
jgi:hypothetical protein